MRPIVQKTCAVSIFIALAAIALYSQQTPSVQPSAQKGWIATWREATVSFGTIAQDPLRGRYYKVEGSGIIFSADATTAYIVTAKHVFFDHHPPEIQMRYGWQDQKSVYAELGTAIKLRDAAGKDLWTALDDDSDLAVIVAPPPTIQHQPAMNPESIAPPEKVYEGANIVALGYPGIVGNEYLVRAISRGGIIAWTDPTDPAGKRFLIDANIYPGNSGGPVISTPLNTTPQGGIALGGSTYLLGIVIEAPGQEGEYDLRVPGQRTPLHIKQKIPLGGTGVVEPASKIRKLLEKVMK
ncbi:MAG: serine protease [Terriglobales bacterium]